MKPKTIIIILLLMLVSIITTTVTAVDCYNCTDCTNKAVASDVVLTLANDIDISSHPNPEGCIEIYGNNVTVDGQGYNITSTSGGRAFVSYGNYTTIQNTNGFNVSSLFKGFGEGLHHTSILNNHFSQIKSEALTFEDGGDYSRIESNYLSSDLHEGGVAFFLFGGSHNYAYNNTIVDFYGGAFNLGSLDGGGVGTNNSIINNSITNGFWGILLTSNSTNSIISGNILTNLTMGIMIGINIPMLNVTSSGTSDVTIVDNELYAIDTFGILVENAFNINITNNIVNTPTGFDIVLNNSVDSVVVGNTLNGDGLYFIGGDAPGNPLAELSGIMKFKAEKEGSVVIDWINPIETAGIVAGVTLQGADGFIAIDSGSLDPTVNTSSVLTFENIDCGDFDLWYDGSYHNDISSLMGSGTKFLLADEGNLGGACNDINVCNPINCVGRT